MKRVDGLCERCEIREKLCFIWSALKIDILFWEFMLWTCELFGSIDRSMMFVLPFFLKHIFMFHTALSPLPHTISISLSFFCSFTLCLKLTMCGDGLWQQIVPSACTCNYPCVAISFLTLSPLFFLSLSLSFALSHLISFCERWKWVVTQFSEMLCFCSFILLNSFLPL